MTDNKNNIKHPSTEKIMEFVNIIPIDMTSDKQREYFDMMVHFSHCEKCRGIKDEMISFCEKTEDILLRECSEISREEIIQKSLDNSDLLRR